MSIPCRLALIAGLLVTATACRQAAPTTALSPLAAPVRADVHHVASGVDSIQLSLRALLRNPLADTLTLEATCGGPALYLEYADGERWGDPCCKES